MVERVIRLSVEKAPISRIENESTFPNRRWRSVAPKSVAARAMISATTAEQTRLPSAHSSILPPASRMSPIALPSVCTIMVISDM